MKILAAFLALGCITACGGKKEAPPTEDKPANPAGAPPTETPAPAAAPAEPAADDRCEVTVEGDIKDHGFASGGPSAVGSDYWMSEDELREALKMMAGALGDKQRDIDADMKKDPRLYTLLLNCQTPRTKISLVPSGGSKYADVPFGPKKYKIAAPQTEKSPGVFQTLVTFDNDTGVWGVDGEGELDITKFDKSGIAGTFRYNMIERKFGDSKLPPRKATIAGRFAFKCSLGTSVCRDAAK